MLALIYKRTKNQNTFFSQPNPLLPLLEANKNFYNINISILILAFCKMSNWLWYYSMEITFQFYVDAFVGVSFPFFFLAFCLINRDWLIVRIAVCILGVTGYFHFDIFSSLERLFPIPFHLFRKMVMNQILPMNFIH